MELDHRKRLEAQIHQLEQRGDAVVGGMVTNFPKNPPPAGIAYSKNFANWQKFGQFAVQVRG